VPSITVDRGCGGVYRVGDPILVQFRIDGVDQAVATIEDILPDGRTQVILQRTVSGNRTHSFSAYIVPPVGLERVRLTAQAGGRIAQAECTFTITY
jgi:hypothetical protein